MPRCQCQISTDKCKSKYPFVCSCSCSKTEESIIKCKHPLEDNHKCVCVYGNGCRRHSSQHVCCCQEVGFKYCLSQGYHSCICLTDFENCRSEKHLCSCKGHDSKICKFKPIYDEEHSCSCISDPKNCRNNDDHICICLAKEPKNCKSKTCSCVCTSKSPGKCRSSKYTCPCSKDFLDFYRPKIIDRQIKGNFIKCKKCGENHEISLDKINNYMTVKLPPELKDMVIKNLKF